MLETKEGHHKEDSMRKAESPAFPVHSFRLSPRTPIEPVLLITRPVTITICAIVLVLSSAITFILLLQGSSQLFPLRQAIHPVMIYLGIGYTVLCGFGYWRMKRWAVLLCGFDVLLRFLCDLPNSFIAIPALVAAFGIISFDDMTWK